MILEDSDATNAALEVDLVDRPRGRDWIERETADRTKRDRTIDEWGQQSFPASDPPPTW